MELQAVLSLGLRDRRQQCGVCKGSGKVLYPDNQGNEWEDECPVCSGIGWIPEQYVPPIFVSESNSD